MNLILIVFAVAIAVAAIQHHYYAIAQAPGNEPCMDAETRDKTRALMFEGINVALVHHTEKLFDNLMKDRGHDPARMTRGMYDSLALYARSRENLLKWSPPACKE